MGKYLNWIVEIFNLLQVHKGSHNMENLDWVTCLPIGPLFGQASLTLTCNGPNFLDAKWANLVPSVIEGPAWARVALPSSLWAGSGQHYGDFHICLWKSGSTHLPIMGNGFPCIWQKNIVLFFSFRTKNCRTKLEKDSIVCKSKSFSVEPVLQKIDWTWIHFGLAIKPLLCRYTCQ